VVLAPPVARVVPNSEHRSFAEEHAWLKEHAREYPGCWLIVLGSELIASGPDVNEVIQLADQIDRTAKGLMHFQPKQFH
jgi:hypothetical protein